MIEKSKNYREIDRNYDPLISSIAVSSEINFYYDTDLTSNDDLIAPINTIFTP